MRHRPSIRLASALILLALAATAARAQEPPPIFSEADYEANSRQVVERDKFPVLTMPEMATAAEGDEALDDDERVIGVVVNGEAKAYPLSVMGRHELANDVCGDLPIAPAW